MAYTLHCGDNLAYLRTMASDSVDSVVTDPPYELGFMGKKWDASGIAHNVELWAEVLRVLKPGGRMLAFAGTRTYHRMTCAIEDAGFEVTDMVNWVFGSGFPKSLDISKALDKAAGATDAARQWQGWGTALKPAHEPICMARKPLTGTYAENVLTHGTGGLNIDGCRVDGADCAAAASPLGRFPANLIHDGSDEVLAAFPSSDPARFFYCAKASRSDRSEGCESMPAKPTGALNMRSDAHAERTGALPEARGNFHPTVKPTDLMRYLCRLVTPPGGLVLDPFNGSGSTGKAAVLEGFRYLGLELNPEYVAISRARIDAALPAPVGWSPPGCRTVAACTWPACGCGENA